MLYMHKSKLKNEGEEIGTVWEEQWKNKRDWKEEIGTVWEEIETMGFDSLWSMYEWERN